MAKLTKKQAWQNRVIDLAFQMGRSRHIEKRRALYMAAHWLYRAGDRMKEGCNVYTGESNAAGQGRREATYPESACSQGGCQ